MRSLIAISADVMPPETSEVGVMSVGRLRAALDAGSGPVYATIADAFGVVGVMYLDAMLMSSGWHVGDTVRMSRCVNLAGQVAVRLDWLDGAVAPSVAHYISGQVGTMQHIG